MKEASIEELTEIMPLNVAKDFYQYLKNLNN